MNTEEVKNTVDKYIMHTYGRDLVIDHAHGSIIYDKEGNEYIDCVAGIAVNNIGHTHDKLVAAITEEIQKLIHVSNLYYTEEQAEYAKKIVERSPHDKVFFANSGAEANEGAIKLAKKYTQKSGIITMNNSFHGRTFETLIATGQDKFHHGFGPLPQGFTHVEYNNIDAVKEAIDDNTAAVLVEPVQGESGVRVPDVEYFKQLRELCDEKGVLLIFDEVQTGFGRTGKLFTSEVYGVYPDITSSAKAVAGGIPMGIVLANEEIADAFGPGDHGTTFGGTPIACKAASTVLDIIEEEDLLTKSTENGQYFRDQLSTLKEKHDCIVEVRGLGMMIGIELNYECGDLVKKALENGVIINVAGGNVVRLIPPLILTRDEIDQVVKVIDKILP